MDKWHNREHKIIGDIETSIMKNKKNMDSIFKDCADIVTKIFWLDAEKRTGIYLCYVDGLTDHEMLEKSLIRPLLQMDFTSYQGDLFTWLTEEKIEIADIKEGKNLNDMVQELLAGNTAIFIEGCQKGLIISSKKLPVRGVSEPESEVVMRGAKDSFNESIRVNTALIRRRIRDTRLKVLQKKVGTRSETDVAIMYISDLVKPGLVEQIEAQLDEICIDGILDSGMIEHLMEKDWMSPFPQFQNTERPDKAASGIMEGRVAIVVDNSPGILLLPVTIHCFFQASDDYYNRFYVASFERFLRYMAAIIAIGLPGLYVAVFNFHTEVLPTSLVLSFAASRIGVPFPTVVEILLMELAFELLREAGVRMPGQMGNTIGVVGGLIVGQAAVEAGLVSTIVVIVVSLTAIASFSIPNESFVSTFRLLKFYLIFTSAFLGIYGFFLGMLTVIIHLCSLSSYGIPYLMPSVAASVDDYNYEKDHTTKWPIRYMEKRPIFTRRDSRVRMKNKEGGGK